MKVAPVVVAAPKTSNCSARALLLKKKRFVLIMPTAETVPSSPFSAKSPSKSPFWPKMSRTSGLAFEVPFLKRRLER